MAESPRNIIYEFAEDLLSSLPWDFGVFTCHFADGKPTAAESPFDYKVFVVADPKRHYDVPLNRLSKPSELPLLECLLLDEVLSHIHIFDYCFVLGARFGPRVNQGLNGKPLYSWEIISLNNKSLLRHLLNDLELLSPCHPLLRGFLNINSRSALPDILKSYADRLRRKEPPSDNYVEVLNFQLGWLMDGVGLAKILAIPSLSSKRERNRLPITKEDASKVSLVEDHFSPPHQTRPIRDPSRLKGHWATVPGRFFIYGHMLDVINVYREKGLIKVCWKCGRLYRPYQYQQHAQRYCSRRCRRRAQSKRHSERKKASKKENPPRN